ncbi:hypothetical protein KIPB_004661 [Kipferlia bialata]|uniref:Uncharacterized protein n=1 Tax=Kipferlia bialata TaxID=797122 RepID=A0A9K3CUU9_9EUKA|nr:hypothetical protein KIPB_004661 [Kipferlia bialata]|eukprot:g4661.t1
MSDCESSSESLSLSMSLYAQADIRASGFATLLPPLVIPLDARLIELIATHLESDTEPMQDSAVIGRARFTVLSISLPDVGVPPPFTSYLPRLRPQHSHGALREWIEAVIVLHTALAHAATGQGRVGQSSATGADSPEDSPATPSDSPSTSPSQSPIHSRSATPTRGLQMQETLLSPIEQLLSAKYRGNSLSLSLSLSGSMENGKTRVPAFLSRHTGRTIKHSASFSSFADTCLSYSPPDSANRYGDMALSFVLHMANSGTMGIGLNPMSDNHYDDIMNNPDRLRQQRGIVVDLASLLVATRSKALRPALYSVVLHSARQYARAIGIQQLLALVSQIFASSQSSNSVTTARLTRLAGHLERSSAAPAYNLLSRNLWTRSLAGLARPSKRLAAMLLPGRAHHHNAAAYASLTADLAVDLVPLAQRAIVTTCTNMHRVLPWAVSEHHEMHAQLDWERERERAKRERGEVVSEFEREALYGREGERETEGEREGESDEDLETEGAGWSLIHSDSGTRLLTSTRRYYSGKLTGTQDVVDILAVPPCVGVPQLGAFHNRTRVVGLSHLPLLGVSTPTHTSTEDVLPSCSIPLLYLLPPPIGGVTADRAAAVSVFGVCVDAVVREVGSIRRSQGSTIMGHISCLLTATAGPLPDRYQRCLLTDSATCLSMSGLSSQQDYVSVPIYLPQTVDIACPPNALEGATAPMLIVDYGLPGSLELLVDDIARAAFTFSLGGILVSHLHFLVSPSATTLADIPLSLLSSLSHSVRQRASALTLFAHARDIHEVVALLLSGFMPVVSKQLARKVLKHAFWTVPKGRASNLPKYNTLTGTLRGVRHSVVLTAEAFMVVIGTGEPPNPSLPAVWMQV